MGSIWSLTIGHQGARQAGERHVFPFDRLLSRLSSLVIFRFRFHYRHRIPLNLVGKRSASYEGERKDRDVKVITSGTPTGLTAAPKMTSWAVHSAEPRATGSFPRWENNYPSYGCRSAANLPTTDSLMRVQKLDHILVCLAFHRRAAEREHVGLFISCSMGLR